MTKSVLLNTARILLTTVWRLIVAAAAAAAVCAVGIAMVMAMVFSGPSPTARDQLTMTLLESELTQNLPAVFLGEEQVRQISSAYLASAGTSDPSLISPSAEGQSSTETLSTAYYTAAITLYPDFRAVPQLSGSGHNYTGFTGTGVLVIAGSYEDLLAQEVYNGTHCAGVLIFDGQVNEALLSSPCGYAPYVAIGQRADGTVIRIVTDGWTLSHPGATCRDLINLMQQYGAVNAWVLDSGLREE